MAVHLSKMAATMIGTNFFEVAGLLIRKLKGSKITGSGTIFQTGFGDKI